MIPALRLPAGRSLTDLWPNLPHPVRRRWLAVVAAEARAVREEAQAARTRAPEPVEVVPDDRAAVLRRVRAMLAETERGRANRWPGKPSLCRK